MTTDAKAPKPSRPRRPPAGGGKPTDPWERLGRIPASSLYLFLGEEDYLIERAVGVVRRRRRGGGGTAVRVLYAGEMRVEDMAAAWETRPLFGGGEEVVWVKRVERLSARDEGVLAAALERRDRGGTPLILSGRRLGGAGELRTFVQAHGVVAEFPRLFPWQLPQWVRREAKERGLALSDEAAEALVELAGPDLGAVVQEMEKISLLAGRGKRLQADEVEWAVGGGARRHSVFELADAVSRRDGRRALLVLRGVLAEGERPLALLGLFVGHLRRVWRAKELLAQGVSEAEVAAVVRLRGPRLTAVLGQARSLSRAHLAAAMRRAADLDQALKSSRGIPAILLEDFVLELCSPSGP
jgi:DNA polymerase-3 subunit delta